MLETTTLNMSDMAHALFTSPLQASVRPDSAQVHAAIDESMRSHGGRASCSALVAQEAGDHPELYAERMRWALNVVHREAYSWPSR
jgi:hypothetical protein